MSGKRNKEVEGVRTYRARILCALWFFHRKAPMQKFILKNDQYRKARGGKAFVVSVICTQCENEVLVYQKDGDGQLKRCYLNRILSPESLEGLQHNTAIQHQKDLPDLCCPTCDVVLGSPIRHHDGRLAFRLRQGFFKKKRLTA